MFPNGDITRISEYYIGSSRPNTTTKDMGDMTEQERRKLFMDACTSVGLPIDPETFSRINEF